MVEDVVETRADPDFQITADTPEQSLQREILTQLRELFRVDSANQPLLFALGTLFDPEKVAKSTTKINYIDLVGNDSKNIAEFIYYSAAQILIEVVSDPTSLASSANNSD